MKKTVILLMSVAALTACKDRNKTAQQTENQAVPAVETVASDIHNSRNSLDWAGTYKGTLPCADCSGIETTITIDKDGNYTRTMKYLGKGDGTEYKETGKFKWNDNGSVITLEGTEGSNLYQVGENRLFHLDREGNRVTGDLAENYVLVKE